MPPKKSAARSGGDWLASLARQSTASDVIQSTSKRKEAKGGAQQQSHATTTKEERIQRREQKKLERQERKRVADEKRDARKLLLQQKKRKRNERAGTEQLVNTSKSSSLATHSSPTLDAPRKSKGKRRGMTEFSKRALVKLCNNIESTVSQYDDTTTTSSIHQRKKHKKNKKSSSDQNDDNTAAQQPTIINGVTADPKGKATKSSTLRPDSKELQPRIRDYNGQGLVRPSLFLPLNDPSFVPKLELEFAEHIPGFFGKAKTKAAKKQSDENMLWRRCLKAKEDEDGGGKKKKKKKKSGGGEDRFESMIRQDVM
eukprot:CAMPEP_0201691300 /NCGR_PEP_ID=MMETSP0578-20130828/4482_1 /ASSEMBLY_ACC=CAM_ASM_000663 /TAXON_ID=267565 /ORGANISM="Skeletonema grethea, Strain CCMP 1804" /LENGTH=312 /DNA_ID=CAMNT_0048176469 /DNA_START=29 /DNA_END=967 /DNA_ORIENTATION=+